MTEAVNIKDFLEKIEEAHMKKKPYSYTIENETFLNQNFFELNLTDISFNNCIFTNCNFIDCYFDNTKFLDCSISNCNFSIIYGRYTSFHGSGLLKVSFFVNIDEKHIMENWDFSFAHLDTVNFSKINKFVDCIFNNAFIDNPSKMPYIPMVCPEEGSFIGYKIARICFYQYTHVGVHETKNVFQYDIALVTLEVPADARRCSGTERKCRCDKAKVLNIVSLADGKEYTQAISYYNSGFKYTKGKWVKEPNFNEDRWDTCSKGIHFFMNKQEAINYIK